MKEGMHPKYELQSFNCSCGNVISIRSTVGGHALEICSNCHPFFTGKQKMVDTAGRVEKFSQKYTSVVGAKRKTRSTKAVKARK